MNINIIYIIKNSINNKVYIGQTWKGINYRFKEHLKSINSGFCPKLYNAMKKHDKDNFYIEAIFSSNGSQKNADECEDYFINLFDSIKNGYNLRGGGSSGLWSEESKQKLSKTKMGHFVSQKTKDAVSNAHKGTVLSEDHKNKISAAVKGENHPLYGTHQSEESRLKNSLSNKKTWENKRRDNLNDKTVVVDIANKSYLNVEGVDKSVQRHDQTIKDLFKIKEKITPNYNGENNAFYGKHHSKLSICKIKYTKFTKQLSKQIDYLYSKPVYKEHFNLDLTKVILGEKRSFKKSLKNTRDENIIKLYLSELNGMQISKQLDVPDTTVYRVIDNFKKESEKKND